MKTIYIYEDGQLREDSQGFYVLLNKEELEQFKNSLKDLEQIKKDLSEIARTLRNVCVDTENPVHFRKGL